MSLPSFRIIKVPMAGIVIFRPDPSIEPGNVVAFIHTVFKIQVQDNVVEYVRFIEKDTEIEVPEGISVWMRILDKETRIG